MIVVKQTLDVNRGLSRLLKYLNAIQRGGYYVDMTCSNGFGTVLARNRHHEYCSSNGHIKVSMLSEEEKWLKFDNFQYPFKIRAALKVS